uniref:E3 ubiquitin-protein ligase n=1 Tax=Caligus clemensi TaxID=344056 RepID=C1BZX5_CALCM|nr:RING finger protein 146 [Caligus clemensi]
MSVELTSGSETALECPVCLQSAVQPVKLPCSHIFCFLCVKGASAQNRTCPLCRSPIQEGYLESPELINEDLNASSHSPETAWFYEGREGWWRYDTRTSNEIEEIYAARQENEENAAELLIAGFIYVIDFDNEVQYRKNRPGRRRKIKRDAFDAPSKGVAGLRKENNSDHKDDHLLSSRFNNLTILEPSAQQRQAPEEQHHGEIGSGDNGEENASSESIS